MKKQILLITTSILALTSCGNQEMELVAERTVNQTSSDLKISPEEAVKSAQKYFAALEEGTRSADRSSYTLSVIKSDNTRANGSELPDSLYYLINYDNEEGFAMMRPTGDFPSFWPFLRKATLI